MKASETENQFAKKPGINIPSSDAKKFGCDLNDNHYKYSENRGTT